MDPQVGGYPAAAFLRVVGEQDRNELEDETLILADVGRTVLARLQDFITGLVRDRVPPERTKELVAPPEVYALMDLYPQPRVSRAAVQFVPAPYHRPPAPVQPARPQ